jgi:hypothetical protein
VTILAVLERLALYLMDLLPSELSGCKNIAQCLSIAGNGHKVNKIPELIVSDFWRRVLSPPTCEKQ